MGPSNIEQKPSQKLPRIQKLRLRKYVSKTIYIYIHTRFRNWKFKIQKLRLGNCTFTIQKLCLPDSETRNSRFRHYVSETANSRFRNFACPIQKQEIQDSKSFFKPPPPKPYMQEYASTSQPHLTIGVTIRLYHGRHGSITASRIPASRS